MCSFALTQTKTYKDFEPSLVGTNGFEIVVDFSRNDCILKKAVKIYLKFKHLKILISLFVYNH